MISAPRREVDENCALLGYYAASNGNFLPTFRDNLSVPSTRVKNPPSYWGFWITHSDAPQVIGLSQRPPHDNTQQLRRINFVLPSGFEPVISGERPQIYALNRSATGTGKVRLYLRQLLRKSQVVCSLYTQAYL